MEPPKLESIKRVLIANRGEIAVRCIRGCRAVGATSVTVYTPSDVASLHVIQADESVMLDGDGTAGYLNIDNILQICSQNTIDAVLPGYGFLSENVEFAKRIKDAGMIFVGPSAESITEMGMKHRARDAAIQANVPVVPGTNLLESEDEALAAASELRYPVMVKATGGGGGMGLQICHAPEEIKAAFSAVRSRGESLFKNAGVLLEKYYPNSRHIEVQVFGNGTETVHFGERECSIQRRHQKVIEECPSPFVERHLELRQSLTECATRYASTLRYKSAGTVEFLVDDETAKFFFLEMNTRLQVEHGITEMCYGVDLVALMLRQADMESAGKGGIPFAELRGLQKTAPNGAAIEARIYAEDPNRGFSPSPGIFQEVGWPDLKGVRIDTWIQSGQKVSLHYDPLLAKAMVHAPTREQAIEKMRAISSGGIALKGPTTNLDLVKAVVTCDAFAKDVLAPGSFTTVQDWPARHSAGYGIPKSGPMDTLSSRVANILAGNPSGQELLEVTLNGPELLFKAPAVVSVCGAPAAVTIDGCERPMWSTLIIQENQTLRIGAIQEGGCRLYIAIQGGFPNIPLVYGSKATTPSLRFGGYQGRQLRQGDFLQLAESTGQWTSTAQEYTLPSTLIPSTTIKEIYVMQGPHDSDDIMTTKDRQRIYSSTWRVGHNSSRTGIRLIGPAPEWARDNGGEAGSHPSNYLDYGYPSPGGVNWGGDSPVIFSVDSPNFGGLICSSTVISAELWKLGQLKPDDNFVMIPVSVGSAVQQIGRIERYMSMISDIVSSQYVNATKVPWSLPRQEVESRVGILKTVEPDPSDTIRPRVTYRQGGDRFILLEYGKQKIDVAVIARIRLLLSKLESQPGLSLRLTPHIGSVAIEYDPLEISQNQLLIRLHKIEATIEANATRNNLEYIRRVNGLRSRREVFEHILNAEHVVVAVGFLCGCPVLFPLSPKKLTCQKYNPTRVSTPGGTLGLGGSILNGYSVEQPGGYMMLARTLELWDSYGTKPGFRADRPWMFEPFDKIKFYEVDTGEYDSLARDFAAGRYQWRISHSTFDVRKTYELFHNARTDTDVSEHEQRQTVGLAEQECIEKELYTQWKAEAELDERRWAKNGTLDDDDPDVSLVKALMAASVWKVEVEPGAVLEEGQVVACLEAMKMEITVTVPKVAHGFIVDAVLRKPGAIVSAGDVIVVAKRQG